MNLLMSPTVEKILLTIGAGIATWAAVAIRRAAKNWGKTKWEIAEEAFQDAVKQAQEAHADNDPSNDDAADDNVERRRRIRDRAKELMALTDAAGDVGEK